MCVCVGGGGDGVGVGVCVWVCVWVGVCVPGIGNLTAVDKISLYIQMVWPIKLKFEIQICGVIILQAKHYISFLKIGLFTFKILVLFFSLFF